MLSSMQRYKARLEKDRGDEGFTLIELLIVIIILAILATIVIFAVGTTTKNAALASCQSTVKTIQTALEAYKAQTPTGSYPTSLAQLATAVTSTGTTKGPWLKSAPHVGAATVTKYGWAFPSADYTSSSGLFKVQVKHTATSSVRSTSTPTVCKGA